MLSHPVARPVEHYVEVHACAAMQNGSRSCNLLKKLGCLWMTSKYISELSQKTLGHPVARPAEHHVEVHACAAALHAWPVDKCDAAVHGL